MVKSVEGWTKLGDLYPKIVEEMKRKEEAGRGTALYMTPEEARFILAHPASYAEATVKYAADVARQSRRANR